MSKMLKLLNKFSDLFLKQSRLDPSIFRVPLYSTQTQTSSSANTLYQRLQRCYQERASLIPVLDKWVVEGRPIAHEELKGFIKSFRKNHRFKPALEIAEWMSEMKHFNTKPGHIAVQLDLISKVHGLEQAEQYFNSLEDDLLVLPVYGALLNCYADAKSLEKAEAVMEKIRKLNCSSTLFYNTMLSLYSQMGMHEKLDSLMQEMEYKGIVFDVFTYNIRLNAYATVSDIEKMEKLLMKMEVDPQVTVNFHTYITAAKGYLKGGASEKASMVLKKAEHLINRHERQYTYGVLITVYATMQEKANVYRIWNLLRKDGKLYNRNYMCMLTSLEKLDDLEGAEKSWRSRVREAEVILNRLLENGKEPTASTWSRMAFGYYENAQMEKAVEMTKKAIMARFPVETGPSYCGGVFGIFEKERRCRWNTRNVDAT
ncbi:hypothetical protein DH2020_002443 [Rehmannia glutinosa]|uniref:Pentatricopeptide repeat-containing protein n=1 Tax=Rehmannia glutinosa TaxID=99300 RepID=A0ABR0XTT3_REHGL